MKHMLVQVKKKTINIVKTKLVIIMIINFVLIKKKFIKHVKIKPVMNMNFIVVQVKRNFTNNVKNKTKTKLINMIFILV